LTIPVHVALVDETGVFDQEELAEVAGALNEQVQADFRPIWGGPGATVGAYRKAPPNTWRIILQEKLDVQGALGYHTDENNVPVSYVDVIGRNGEIDPGWTVTASHELLEMLADPWGSRMHAARLPQMVTEADLGLPKPKAHQVTRVSYLLEVADPPEAASYEVGGVAVSDFITPDWYRTNPKVSEAYSHQGTCIQPREVAPGGYVSFMLADRDWWQVYNINGRLRFAHLGRFDRKEFATLRAFTDTRSREVKTSGALDG
jgi:hypothetical protein